MNKWQKYYNSIQSTLFGIGMLCLLFAIGFKSPETTLISFITGVVCILPITFSLLFSAEGKQAGSQKKRLDKKRGILEGCIAVFGFCFYAILIAMKVIRGFGHSIANWMGYLWLSMIAAVFVCICIREFILNKQKKQITNPVQEERKAEPAGKDNRIQTESVHILTPEPVKQTPVMLEEIKDHIAPEQNKKAEPKSTPVKKSPHPSVSAKPSAEKVFKPKQDHSRLVLAGRQSPSHGDTELYELTLLVSEKGPELLWSVTWRGGYSHADGTGDTILVPIDILEKQNSTALVAWIKSAIPMPTAELVNWEDVQTNPEIDLWLRFVKPKENKGASMKNRLSSHWAWHEVAKSFDADIAWDKTNGYQLIFRPERSPSVVVRKSEDENLFMQYALLYLVSLKPEGFGKISSEFTPLAQNYQPGHLEHGIEHLFLEQWSEREYLLWYIRQEFDTQNGAKLLSEFSDFRSISVSDRKEFFPEEYLKQSGLGEKWSTWAVEALSGNKRFTNLFRSRNIPAIDYPVPFSKMMIYPNRVYTKKGHAQVLYEWESGSFGRKFKNKVSLFHKELISEYYVQGEYGPDSNLEEMVHVWLAMLPQPVHHRPLTNWILSVRGSMLYHYAQSVCVTMNEPSTQGNWREILLKDSRKRISHDQPGWNCEYDTITLRCYPDSSWSLCRDSLWREAPSGLPYHALIEIKLLPGVEKESEEKLLSIIENLPWNNPNQALASTQILHNWMDRDFLKDLLEHLTVQAQANPRFGGYREIDEVQRQLTLLK